MFKKRSIEYNREISNIFREIRQGSKPKNCILCGKPQSSFCVSHSVPRFVLKNIAVDGKVKTYNAITGLNPFETEVGVAKAMTFQFICRECDSKCFSNYESEEILQEKNISNIALAEIALKNHLLMRYKWSMDEKFTEYSSEHKMMLGIDVKNDMDRLTLRDNLHNIAVAKSALENSKSNTFRIIWHAFLDWQVPICIQTEMTMREDIQGGIINDVFDLSEENRIESIHLCVFPLKEKTMILLFYNNSDVKYRNFETQFRQLSVSEKLILINYLIFEYTEHVLMSPKIPEKYFRNRKLKSLCKDNMIKTLWDFLHPLPKIHPYQIPNFLTKEFAEEMKINININNHLFRLITKRKAKK